MSRSRHGFHEPWFEGPAPGRDLAGTATWRGRLLGRTAASGATLDVVLAGPSGSLDFSALEVWTDAPRTHRTLDCAISIAGNRLVRTRGAEGTVTGVFVGPNHEVMGGVLERTDPTASFAGRRWTARPREHRHDDALVMRGASRP